MNKPHKPTHRLRARTVIDCETGFMCLVAGCWWLHKQAWQVSNEACQVRVLTRATVPQLSWTVPINMQAKSTHKSSKTNNMRLLHLHSTHQGAETNQTHSFAVANTGCLLGPGCQPGLLGGLA